MNMKKTALVAGAFVTGAAAFGVASADTAVYGHANVSVQSEDNGTDSTIKLRSNASRLGLKGETDLAAGGTVFYVAEYEVFIDSGDDANQETFTKREVYAGLTGAYGTIRGGHFDTALKASQGGVDQFDDLLGGDIGGVIHGEQRGSNQIEYTSNALVDGKMFVTVGTVLDEDQTSNDNTRAYTAAVSFDMDNMSATVAYVDDNDGVIGGAAIGAATETLRFSGEISLEGDLQIGAIVQYVENNQNDDGMQYVVSGAMPFGDNVVTAQYAYSDSEVAMNDVESQYNVGIERALGEKVNGYAYYGGQTLVSGSDEASTFGVGMEVKF